MKVTLYVDWFFYTAELGDMLECRSAMTSSQQQVLDDDVTDHVTDHVLDMASLMLRRMNAVPVRLKILLDRLLTSLRAERVRAILEQCGWTYDDYVRGYKLQVGLPMHVQTTV